mmetsp:Transcript_7151/g.22584  ORF Transcript_7151/g.22584 Transcript_7151/m.22584 type:complete len:140 (-) Transcript_7151:169-588(-)
MNSDDRKLEQLHRVYRQDLIRRHVRPGVVCDLAIDDMTFQSTWTLSQMPADSTPTLAPTPAPPPANSASAQAPRPAPATATPKPARAWMTTYELQVVGIGFAPAGSRPSAHERRGRRRRHRGRRAVPQLAEFRRHDFRS